MKSWQTSASGLVAILTSLAPIANALTDGNPATVPDWQVAIPGLAAGIGLLCARDNNKTSEQVGAKPQKQPVAKSLIAVGLFALLAFSGCTTVHQSASTVDPDGTRRETTIDVTSSGDAKQVVAELRASNGKTHALGAKGVEQEASLEGLVKLFEMIFNAGKSAGTAAATGGVIR